jgi:putative membrane protein
MPVLLKEFLKRWVICIAAVAVSSELIKGIGYDTIPGLLVATLLLGIVNALLRPFKIILSIFTLGIFALIFNALVLYWVGSLVKSFHVDSFAAAFWGGLLISIVSVVLNLLTGTGGSQLRYKRAAATPTPPTRGDDGGGPVIDI